MDRGSGIGFVNSGFGVVVGWAGPHGNVCTDRRDHTRHTPSLGHSLRDTPHHCRNTQGQFVSCADSQRLCHLNCVVPKERSDTEKAWPVNQPMTKDQVANACIDDPRRSPLDKPTHHCTHLYR